MASDVKKLRFLTSLAIVALLILWPPQAAYYLEVFHVGLRSPELDG